MKKFFYIPMLLFFLLIAGCSDDSDDSNVILKIKKTDINITAAGGTGTIEVSAPGAVSASSSDEWCSVNVSDNIVTVTASENKDRSNRTAMILISYNGENITVPVTQKCAFLIIESSSLNFSFQGGSQELAITSSLSFSVIIDNDWLTYSIEEGKIILTAEAYTGNELRTNKVTISSGNMTEEVSVSQDKVALLLDQTSLSFSGEGGTNKITVLSNIEFEVTVVDDWITYTVEDNVVTFNAVKSSETAARTSTVTFTSGILTVQVLVTQKVSLIGDWKMDYDDEDGVAQQLIVTLTDNNDGSYIMSGLPVGFNVVVKYNNNGDLIIQNSQYLGIFSSYYIFLCMSDGEDVSWSPDIQYKASYTDGKSFTFADNGTWTSKTVSGIWFYAFSEMTPSSSTALGFLVIMDNIVLSRD